MKKENIENKFNIGIPCYNHTFFDLQDTTMKCYIKGYGDKAINNERNLRYDSLKYINDNSNIKVKLSDGLFHYLSISSNTKNSNAQFGFNDTTKLCSLFYPDYKSNICVINDDNINHYIDKISKNEELKELYRIKDLLLNKNYTDLENDYFKYLDEYLVDKMIVTKYCNNILYLVNNNKLDLAQKYLFVISAYSKVYNNMVIYLNGSYTSLDNFIKFITENYNLKDEYLLRSGFLNNSFSSNNNIIDSIIKKKDIYINEEICKEGKVEHNDSSETITKRVKPSNEDIVYIDEILNDRRMFYLSLNPSCEIRPNGSLSKYGAFIYDNGIIVADRLYDIKTMGNLSKDAIYKFNSLNFEDRIKLTKQELTNLGNSKFYHTKTWKDRTSDYINSNTSIEMKEQVKKLIK